MSFKHAEREQCLRLRTYYDLFKPLSKIIDSSEYKKLAANRLSDAVKIPTIVGDGMGRVGEDSGWDIFYSFSKYLRNTFPRV
jgi:hypothetical protein